MISKVIITSFVLVVNIRFYANLTNLIFNNYKTPLAI
jgi:hypothetical protein